MTADRRRMSSFDQWVAEVPDRAEAMRAALGDANWLALQRHWRLAARDAQRAPEGDWLVWLIMAGRGFGKTRAGAEWVDGFARAHPGSRIALVGATMDDVRQVMIEGESGLLAVAGDRQAPLWNPSLGRLIWPGGTLAACYSAAEPEGLRGPAHHLAWADEVARWDAGGGSAGGARDAAARTRGQRAWDNLMMGLRLGEHPRVLATTTPRAVPVLRAILAMDGVRVTGGPSGDNAANLSGSFLDAMQRTYGDTLLGRQEIGGELIEDVPGALWTRGMLEGCRLAEVGAVVPPSPSYGSQRAGNLRYPLPQGEREKGADLALSRVVIGVEATRLTSTNSSASNSRVARPPAPASPRRASRTR